MCFAPQRRTLFRHFFDIWTSKSGPSMWCFVHFHLEMCFAPQRRALFRHRNFQKWSGAGVFCTFSLGNVLRATTACTFSTSQLPKVVRSWCVLYIFTWKCASRHNGVHFFDIATSKSGSTLVFCTFSLGNVLRATTACTFSTSQLPKVVRHWCVLYIFTWKCASRHNGVHFFISHLARCLRTRRFSEPTFRPSGATNPLEKHSESRLSYLFAHLHLLSSDLFSSELSRLSDSSLLCFSSVHIVGSLASKLPSIIYCSLQHTTSHNYFHDWFFVGVCYISPSFATHARRREVPLTCWPTFFNLPAGCRSQGPSEWPHRFLRARRRKWRTSSAKVGRTSRRYTSQLITRIIRELWLHFI